MTTITIDIPAPQLPALIAKAKAQGLSLEAWSSKIAAKEAEPAGAASTHQTGFEEWERTFDEWIASHDFNTPVLSKEAMRRENIYPDRS